MTRQPSLIDVPGILLRTTLRFIARVLLLVAWFGLIATVTTFYAAFMLSTWRSARTPRTQAIYAIVEGVTVLYRSFNKPPEV